MHHLGLYVQLESMTIQSIPKYATDLLTNRNYTVQYHVVLTLGRL